MSQIICNIFLLVTLLTVISTPANATPLERRWADNTKCCPVSVCVFKQGQNPIGPGVISGYNANTFNGILSFTESPKDTLQISGFIDIHGVINGPSPNFSPGGPVDSVYDIHVAECDAKTSDHPGDNTGIDLDQQSFAQPIRTSKSSMSIDKIRDKCCFVVEEFAYNNGATATVPLSIQRIYGIAKVEPVVTC